MSGIIEMTGDLFNSTARAYGHGVNCHGVMGAGIAKVFKDKYPQMYLEYRALCERRVQPLHPGECYAWTNWKSDPHKPGDTVFNLASQDLPGPDARLHWLKNALHAIPLISYVPRSDWRIALPRIGCGIGGLQWDDVRPIIEEYASYADVTVEVWSL